MKFLRIHLGWSSGASGLCCLEWTQEQLQIRDLGCKEAYAKRTLRERRHPLDRALGTP